MTTERIARVVERHLAKRQPRKFKLKIDRSGIWFEENWWNVIVRPDRTDVRAFDYADALSEVEQAIRDEGKVKILLVPALAGT